MAFLWKSGDKWLIRIKSKRIAPQFPNGVNIATGLTNKEAAQRVLVQLQADLLARRLNIQDVVRVASKMLFLNDLIDKYNALTEVRKTTKDRYNLAFDHLKAEMGNIPLQAISFEKLQEFKIKRLGQVRPATVNTEIRAIKTLLNFGAQNNFMFQNPAEHLKPARVPVEEDPTFTRSQIETLECHIKGLMEKPPTSTNAIWYREWLDIITLAKNTGMRLSEITNAGWENIEWERNLIAVRNVVEDEGETKEFLTKTGGIRSIPLSQAAKEMLLRRKSEKNSSPYIFANVRTGERRNSHRMSRQFVIFVKGAGLPKNLTFHSLRSYFATRCAESNVPVHKLQYWLGHSSVTTTMKYYVKTDRNTFAEDIKRVDL